jgi:flagellar L-ring protein FlgH
MRSIKRTMRTRLIAPLVAAVLAAAPLHAKSGKKATPSEKPFSLDQYIEEITRQSVQSQAGQNGSIWTPDARYLDLAIDLRARRVNDLVTVLVEESASAVTTGTTKSKRTSSAQASIPALKGIPNPMGPLPNLLKTDSNMELDGAGTTSRSTLVRTTLSARVTHVLPNGNLVIEGNRSLVVNSEAQAVTVRGIVRPIDIDTGNQVYSSRIAQMEVKINGRGVVGDAIRRPNLLYRILLGILPF